MHSPIQNDGMIESQIEHNIINEMQHTHINMRHDNNTYN